MDVKITLKVLAAQENISMAELLRRFSKHTGKEYSRYSFANRMHKGTVHYNEVDKIAEMLGYKIKFEKQGE